MFDILYRFFNAHSTEDLDLFIYYARSGNLDYLETLLIENRIDPITQDNKAFRWAARYGHLSVVNRLLRIPEVLANVTAMDNYALRFAIRNGHLAVVERLFQIPAVLENAAAENNEALRWAAETGYLAGVERLLQIPTVLENVTAEYNAVLRSAAYYGHLSVIERLLQIPAVLENAAAKDNAALRYAARNGQIAVINRLLQIPAVRKHQSFQEIVTNYPAAKKCWETPLNRAALEFMKLSLRGNTHFSDLPPEMFHKILSYTLPARKQSNTFFEAAFDSLMVISSPSLNSESKNEYACENEEDCYIISEDKTPIIENATASLRKRKCDDDADENLSKRRRI